VALPEHLVGLGTLEASRTAVGEQCTYRIEVHGDRGALGWDFQRMGELRLCLDQDFQDASYVTRYVAPGAGELGRFQPGSGIAVGYDDVKVIEAKRLVRSIARNAGRRDDRGRAGGRGARRRDGHLRRLRGLGQLLMSPNL
jgi:predicted dehydrogenase